MTDPTTTTTSETAGASAARVNRDELRKVVHNFECANLSHGGIGVLLTAARELLARDEAHAREPICESGCGPAVTADPEGVPLCQGCADNLRATASEARDEAKGDAPLRKAAAALLARLDAINEHPSYNTAFGMAYAHGHRYDGPTWTQEAFALRRLLAPAPPVEPSAEERRRAYDHGPDGDATTPGFFGGATK